MEQDKSLKITLPGVLIITALVVLLLIYLKSILVPIVLAILLSVAVAPLAGYLRKNGWRKIPSSLISILTIVLLLASFGYMIVVEVGEITDKQEAIMNKMTYYNQLLIDKFSNSRMGESLVNIYRKEVTTEEYLSQMFKNSSGSLSASFDILISMALIPLYMFFFLVYSDFFIFAIRRIFSRFDTSEYIQLINSSERVIQSYFQGFLKVTAILAVLNCTGLFILGVDGALFYGIMAALLSVIPYFGVFLGSLLPAFMALVTKDSAWYALGVIGWMSLVQILEGNFITPYIVGDQVKINPFMVLVFLLTAGKIWGVIGLMVAIPMAAVFKQICYHVPALNSVRYLMNPFPEDPKRGNKSSKFSIKDISTFKQS